MHLSTATIRQSTYTELVTICLQLRTRLIQHFVEHGGHVGSNLGVVELLVSLLKEFDYHRNRIFIDTGHQGYLLKLLTERPLPFSTIRQTGGLSGFMSKDEHPRDLYISGHGGTGISAAIGLCRAFELGLANREKMEDVVCLTGDAVLSEGLALEALNNLPPAAHSRLILVVNDNGYSIEKNVGAIGKTLQNETAARNFFSNFGFTYIHCEDGHDLQRLSVGWSSVKRAQGHCIFHVRTQKGHGFEPAELDERRKMHYSFPFDFHTGQPVPQQAGQVRYVDIGGQALVALREKYRHIVVVTQGMCGGNGLDEFQARFPESFYDVGMSEQHAVGCANGLVIGGKLPIIAMHAAFLPRAFDQILQDICLQNIHAILLIGRSGFAGPDGPTHHGVYDHTYLRCLPNLALLSPKTGSEYFQMIEYAVEKHQGPIVILTPHAHTAWHPSPYQSNNVVAPFDIQESGSDFLVMASGEIFSEARRVYELLCQRGMLSGLAHIRWLKPFNAVACMVLMRLYRRVLVMEESAIYGGIGSEIAHLAAEDRTLPPVRIYGVPDRFYPHGDISTLRRLAQVDALSIIRDLEDQQWLNCGVSSSAIQLRS